MAGARLIPVSVGDVEIAVETILVAGAEPAAKAAGDKAQGEVSEAFVHAQEAITQIARSTAAMIARTGPAARPDQVEVEFGLGFSATGGVILAKAASDASLRVTLIYDPAARRAEAGAPLPSLSRSGGSL